MARIPVRLFILALLFSSPALAQSNWLHPSDREYKYAIESASGEAKAGHENSEALEFIRPLPSGTDSYVSVRPPLACANVNAIARKRDLERAPTVDDVKKLCDGRLLVAVRYAAAPSDLDRFLLVSHGDREIKPSRSFYDTAHALAAADDSVASKDSQYAYLDVYFVVPDAAWSDDVMFVTSDVDRQQSTLIFDFSSQVENEEQIAAASR